MIQYFTLQLKVRRDPRAGWSHVASTEATKEEIDNRAAMTAYARLKLPGKEIRDLTVERGPLNCYILQVTVI